MPIYDADHLADFPFDAFADVIAGNEHFAETFSDSGLTGQAMRESMQVMTARPRNA